jgi:hypothetical protein
MTCTRHAARQVDKILEVGFLRASWTCSKTGYLDANLRDRGGYKSVSRRNININSFIHGDIFMLDIFISKH